MEADEKVLDCRVHKLLIQPFVENVIINGFEGLKKCGIIKIKVEEMGGSIQIFIEDNGKGMKEEIVAALNSSEDKPIDTKDSGLGMRNVFNRIKMYYGEKGSWKVTSIP